uniref:WD repeat domain 63 n=1 Tax=Sphaeramia orbicularis TaxID=375764 RepID=A0A673CAJ7_9TELE
MGKNYELDELFGCRTDEDVTKENPYKLLKKDDIIQDIKTRAAVSDFSPVKQIVLNYPEDELLLVYDRDFTYGQSFYLVLTPEAKNEILAPPKPETPEVPAVEIIKTPEPKPWISLGSEQEIEEESVRETRKKALQYKIQIKYRKVDAPLCFSDRNTADAEDGYLECPSYLDSRFSIKQMQRDCGVQAVPVLQSSSAQTQWYRNIFTVYKPRDLQEDEIENILQHCDRLVLHALQQEEIMNVFFDDWKALGTGAEESNWSERESEVLMLYQAFTDQKYSKDKKISCINWHPTIYGALAVALSKKAEKQSTTHDVRPSPILFYNFSDPSTPQLLLECPDDILAFEFSPSDPNVIVGGSVKGQVVLWDISAHVTYLQGSQPGSRNVPVNSNPIDLLDSKENKTPVVHFCAVSALEGGYKAPITDVHWLPQTFEVTRMGLPVENQHNAAFQFITCAPDSSLWFWDIRPPRLLSYTASDVKQNADQMPQMPLYAVPETFKHLDQTWKPLFKVSLPKIDTSGEYVPLKFSLEHYTCKSMTGRTTGESFTLEADWVYLPFHCFHHKCNTGKSTDSFNMCFYLQHGEIVYTDWKLEKDDSGRLQSAKPLHCLRIHHSMVKTVQRSPFFKDIILTTGSWNFAIWKEGVMVTRCAPCTAACWSLSRPAVFFIGKEDGSIEVWNLLQKTNEPAKVNAHVTNGKITCIKPWIASSKQHFLSVCDDLGMVRVFEISRSLYNPTKNEVTQLKSRQPPPVSIYHDMCTIVLTCAE